MKFERHNGRIPVSSNGGASSPEQIRTRKREALLRLLNEVEAGPNPIGYPLSYSQEAYWVFLQTAPDSPFYINHLAADLEGPLDPERLRKCIAILRRRRAVLRTCFLLAAEGPVQRVLEEFENELPLTDLSDLDGDERQREVRRLTVLDASTPFRDIDRKPPFRVALLRLDRNHHRLLIAAHHIVMDGLSNQLVLNEIARLYRDDSGDDANVPGATLQYSDYAQWQRHQLSNGRLRGGLEYWTDRLAGAPRLELPIDKRRPNQLAFRGSLASIEFSTETAGACDALARELGLTHFALLFAVLNIAFSSWTGERDLVIGTLVTDREKDGFADMPGDFTNFLALRTIVDEEASFRDFALRTRRTLLEDFAWKDIPFAEVVRATGARRESSRNPLYDSAFLLHDREGDDALEFSADLHARADYKTRDLARVSVLDLRFEAMKLGERLRLDCEFSVELFEERTIQEFLERFERVLESSLEDPESPLTRLIGAGEAGASPSDAPLVIAIAATFTAEPLGEYVQERFARIGSRPRIRFSSFNQVFQTLLDPEGEFARNEDGLNVVLFRLQDWSGDVTGGPIEAATERLMQEVRRLVQAVHAGPARGEFLIMECPAAPALEERPEVARVFESARSFLRDELKHQPRAAFVEARSLLARAGDMRWFDARTEELGAIPYSEDFYELMADVFVGRKSQSEISYKAIVVDCDETLWRGVVGEVGPEGLVIDASSKLLQEFLVERVNAGMLLALCSKNEAHDVEAVFRTRADMPLKLEHVAAMRVNWKRKHENLRELAAELNLGLDAFIFMDDNPIECADMRARLPEVLTLQVPGDDVELDAMLASQPAFQARAATAEDRQRTAHYRRERERERLREAAPTLEEFIAGLNLEVDIEPLASADLTRAAQLSVRVNQFNLTGVRRTRDDLRAVQARIEFRRVSVKDRYGDYGMVGLLGFAPSIRGDLEIETFLLSCRALGRGVEDRILDYLLRSAAARGHRRLRFQFRNTQRNTPARNFLERVGTFDPEDNTFMVKVPAPGAPTRNEAAPDETVDLETAILKAWEKILKQSDLKNTDNFFDIGGTSLQATRFAALDDFGVRLTISDVFNHPTPREMGVRIHELRAALRPAPPQPAPSEPSPLRSPAAHIPGDAPIERIAAPRTGRFPLSYSQLSMWYFDQLLPGNAMFDAPVCMLLRGEMRPARIGPPLKKALGLLVLRHESLRSAYRLDNDEPTQIVMDPWEPPLSAIDLRAEPPEQREFRLARVFEEESRTPFDLEQGRVLRASIVLLSDEEAVLLLNVHHVACDGFSLGIILNELWDTVQNIQQGVASVASSPPGYADFATAQLKRLAERPGEEHLEYWRGILENMPVTMPLPDRTVPMHMTRGAGLTGVFLPPDILEQIAPLVREERVSPFMVLLTTFKLALARHTRTRDVSVLSVVSGREDEHYSDSVGFFANPIVLRTKFAEDPSLDDALHLVRQSVLDAHARSDLPLTYIIERLNREKVQINMPRIFFQFLDNPASMRVLEGVTATPLFFGGSQNRFELELHILQDGPRLRALLVFNRDLYTDAVPVALMKTWVRLLKEIPGDRNRPISLLNALQPDEESRLAAEFRGIRTAYSQEHSIPEIFRRRAATSPNAVAISGKNEELSYERLDLLSDFLAEELFRRGLKIEDRVGLFMERSAELIVSMLGVLKAGGACVILDPALPEMRIRSVLQEAEVGLTLSSGLRLPLADAPVADARDLWNRGGERRGATRERRVSIRGNDLALVIFTSTAKGSPRATGITHRNIINLTRDAGYMRLDEQESVAHLNAPDMAYSLLEVWGPLLNGGRCVLFGTGRLDHADIPEAASGESVSTLFLTAGQFNYLADTAPESLTGVRQIMSGGDILSLAYAERMLPAGAEDRTLIGGYGPVENTALSTTYALKSTRDLDGPPPMGASIANTTLYLLDEKLTAVPRGVPGEIFVAGESLAMGYLNDPVATAEKFLPDPYSDEPGGRMFRTGDVARRLPDGNLQFLGRIDNQINIRGYQTDPGEVEAYLREHALVHQVCVMVGYGGAVFEADSNKELLFENTLIAYVVPHGGDRRFVSPRSPEKLQEDLESHLRARLPERLLPSRYFIVDSLPLTANGDIDRPALLAREFSAYIPLREFVAPRNSMERRLAEIWKKILGVDEVGIYDDFFELGGSSLDAIKLRNEIRRRLNRDVPLSALFQGLGIASIAQYLRRRIVSTPNSPVIPLKPSGSRPPLFYVHGVEGNALCFLNLARRLSEEQPLYGFQALGLDDGAAPLTNIRDMARRYVESLRVIQTGGPYYLGGWSVGGLIAYEMASILRAKGEQVAMLALLDTLPPALDANAAQGGILDVMGAIAGLLSMYVGHGLGSYNELRELARVLGISLPSRRELAEIEIDEIIEYIKDAATDLPRVLRVAYANLVAGLTYAPPAPRDDISVVLFRAQQSSVLKGFQVDPVLGGWNAFLRRSLHLQTVPGSHITMLQKRHVGALAERMDLWLTRLRWNAPFLEG